MRLPDADGNRDELCLLTIVGVRADGTKELVAVVDGYRESTESWAEVLRDLTDGGMRAPGADGRRRRARAVGGATHRVAPDAHAAVLVHKTARVLSALPTRLNLDAKRLIHGISYAESRTDALQAAKVLADELADHPKAVAKITRDLYALTAFFDFPAQHHKHLRSTNPIESTFATVRLRTQVTRGAGSRDAAIAMAYTLLDAAQQR